MSVTCVIQQSAINSNQSESESNSRFLVKKLVKGTWEWVMVDLETSEYARPVNRRVTKPTRPDLGNPKIINPKMKVASRGGMFPPSRPSRVTELNFMKIYISYVPKDKEQVLILKTKLENEGYTFCKKVEESEVFLCCLRSIYCQYKKQEIELAHRLNKRIILLLMDGSF